MLSFWDEHFLWRFAYELFNGQPSEVTEIQPKEVQPGAVEGVIVSEPSFDIFHDVFRDDGVDAPGIHVLIICRTCFLTSFFILG